MYHEGNDSIKDRCIIIFSGFNQRAVITFLRTLEYHNLKYAIIAKSINDDIFLTHYEKNVLSVRRSVILDLDDILLTIEEVKERLQVNEYIIAPSTEALNRLLIDQREHFENRGCIVPLVDKNLYELISDKYSFGEFCSKNQILTPKQVDFSEEVLLPVVAKPRKYYSATTKDILSPIIIKDLNEFDLFIKKHNIKDYYLQEFIDGRSFYLLYYFSRNGTVYKFSQENLIQQPDGKSMVAAVSTNFHNSYESEKYETLFKSINFFGLVMVEVKQTNGKNYMIEANPRFWGPSQLFLDSGMNLFEAFLHDFSILENSPKFHEPHNYVRYFWLGGIVETHKRGKQLVYHKNSEYELMDSLPTWLQSDIYRKTDTIEVFKKEIFK